MNIYKAIREQFNINDLDFSEDTYDNNIFDKDINVIKEIYNKMLNKENVPQMYIEFLNGIVSGYAPVQHDDMFAICSYYSQKCPEESLNWLDVSGITDMSFMFYLSEFNGDISKWDVSNVTNMSSMFMGSVFNKDISKWDVSNVTDMTNMFGISNFNQDISRWNVSNVTNMSSMFYKSDFTQDISQWDVSNVIQYNSIFSYCNIPYSHKPNKFRR